MSTIHPGSPRDDADESPFTVEDAGSTTDASDLVGGERARQGDAAFADDDVVASSGGAATRVTSTEPVRTDGTSVPRDTTGTDGGAHAVTGTADLPDTEPTAVSHDLDGHDHAGHDHDGHDHDGHDHDGHDHDGHDHDAAASANAGAPDRGLTALDDDGSISHVFDQTNGVIEGLEGDSDGSAESDDLSRAEREDENPDLFHDGLARGERADDSRSTGA